MATSCASCDRRIETHGSYLTERGQTCGACYHLEGAETLLESDGVWEHGLLLAAASLFTLPVLPFVVAVIVGFVNGAYFYDRGCEQDGMEPVVWWGCLWVQLPPLIWLGLGAYGRSAHAWRSNLVLGREGWRSSPFIVAAAALGICAVAIGTLLLLSLAPWVVPEPDPLPYVMLDG